MDKSLRHIVIFCSFLLPVSLYAQLSPGDLSEAHKHLEGLSNCTQCHDLGNKVPDNKCLECHTEIQSLINENRGFHSSIDVVNQNCTVCHNEHHGRKFDMIRFDEENFDHSLTAYDLDGEHGIQECKSCHKPDFIKDPEIKKRTNTFLGLDQACLTCHDDYHQEALGKDCASCHDFDAFKPATYFNHEETEFRLIGAHNEVECLLCHPMENRNGLDYQVFSDLSFSTCVDCHDDPHTFDISVNCKTCHKETAWSDFMGSKLFDHNKTDFDLKGSHKNIDCFACHNSDLGVGDIFMDRKEVATTDCIQCHEDVHEDKFGLDCASCHNEESFYLLNNMDLFDHDLTDYPLEGLHVELECTACHVSESYTEEIPFDNCFDCHEDYHNGEFVENEVQRDCDQCHTLTDDFTYTTFGFIEHQESEFPLEGAHLATPCFACHVSEDHWTFKSLGQTCIECHDDIHQEYITATFYPNQDCTICHSSESWTDINFDHNQTEWPLIGEHLNATCAECHINRDDNNLLVSQEFLNLSTTCYDCHINPHGDQFEEQGITDCAKCHTSNNWSPDLFNHSSTEFPLDGKHAEVECRACHSETSIMDGEERIIYTMESFECIDCHL